MRNLKSFNEMSFGKMDFWKEKKMVDDCINQDIINFIIDKLINFSDSGYKLIINIGHIEPNGKYIVDIEHYYHPDEDPTYYIITMSGGQDKIRILQDGGVLYSVFLVYDGYSEQPSHVMEKVKELLSSKLHVFTGSEIPRRFRGYGLLCKVK